jgi:hypothetical protein
MTAKYETKDFYLACYLFAEGKELVQRKRDKNVTTFTFSLSPSDEKIINDYYNRKLAVEVISFGNAIKALKSIIYSTSSNEGKSNYELTIKTTKKG